MKRAGLLFVLMAICMFSVGCGAMAYAPVSGFLFSDTKGPWAVGTGAATKTGEACSQSILGWVAIGDASIDAAKQAGGITEVAYVDHHSTGILGVYAKFCTIVKGR